MIKYSLKRLARSLFSFALVVAVVFCLLRMMPIEGYFSEYDKMTETQIQNELEKMGLTDPIYIQLGRFYLQLLKGDLGTSNKYRVNYPIAKIIAKKAPLSIRFGLMAMAISFPGGILLGVFMARKKGGWIDRLGTGYIILMQAVPSAVWYLFIQLYGTSALGIGILYNEDKPITWVLPILSLALPSMAGTSMWIRRYMLDEANRDYVLMAKAKGVPSRDVSLNHTFRNAFVPVVQTIPGSLLSTISGSIYVESLYSIPGMGGLLVDVIKRQDNTMVQALVVLYAGISILSLFLGDILLGIVDPRISLTKKEGR